MTYLKRLWFAHSFSIFFSKFRVEDLWLRLELILSSDLFDKIEAVIKALHSYNVPEIIGLPVIVGSEDYLGWIAHETNL